MNTSRFTKPFFVLSLFVVMGLVASTTAGSLTVLNPAAPAAVFWNLTGNTGSNPNKNFLGTTDNQPLVIKTNNTEALRVGVDGAVMAKKVGELTPGAGLTLGSDLRFNNKLRLPSSYMIYTDGITTYALNGQTGKIDFQGVDAAEVIRSTFGKHRHILISSGLYRITSPMDLVDDIALEMENGAILEVPNGYEGYVFGLKSRPASEEFGTNNVRITGGTIREERTDAWDPNPPPVPLYPQRKWTAFWLLVEHTMGGVFFNTIRDVRIDDPNVAIKLEERPPCSIDVSNPRDWCWINNNVFDNLLIYEPNTYIEFAVDKDVYDPLIRAQFSDNVFQNIQGQSGYNTLFGVKNIRGTDNMFVGVTLYDIKNPAGVSANVLQYFAEDTIIIGGAMTYAKFEDKGWRTQIIDLSMNRRLTTEELEIGTSSMEKAFFFRADEDLLRVWEYSQKLYTGKDSMHLTPEGILMINQLDELTPGAGLTLQSDLNFQDNYRLFVGADGLYLEDLNTGKIYKLTMEEVTVTP
jgi:hypothetical protein